MLTQNPYRGVVITADLQNKAAMRAVHSAA